MAKEQIKKDKRFFKDFKAELKKVIWPSTKQLITNTSAVIIIVLIIAAIVFVLDVAFESMNTYGIDRLKSLTTSNEQVVVDENQNSENNTENVVENQVNELNVEQTNEAQEGNSETNATTDTTVNESNESSEE